MINNKRNNIYNFIYELLSFYKEILFYYNDHKLCFEFKIQPK
jgi:hypothetical protein